MNPEDKEPPPLAALEPFEEWDFAALAPERARSPEYDERRLRARRRLGAIAKALVQRAKGAGLALDSRTSLHHPHAFNGQRVERLWTYVTRPKAEKSRLKKVLGAELAKDLDQAYRNAYLCAALEHTALEVSLRIHPDAWFDAQNFVKRTRKEGTRELLALLRELDGFRLRIADWRGEWPCGALTVEGLAEFLRFFVPGEHLFAIERRWSKGAPGPAEAAGGAIGDFLAPSAPLRLVAEMERLLPVYRWLAWSASSDHLFG